MMQLKKYQGDTLTALRRFLEEARFAGAKNAYERLTLEYELAERLGRYRTSYTPLEGLPDVPLVCLRLPTGGGKTILAAHAIGVARDAWVEKDYPLVLWLVPSNTIRLQTVEALRNPRHPYRQVLDEQFAGRVRVFDITDFTTIRPQDIRDNACIIVGTIQTLRVNNTDGRKVYAHNEDMEPHFSAISPNYPGLEQVEGATGATGHPRFSFANLLNVHRPLMIVDEAHNAVTGLTRDMQVRVNPCAIIEFTATPRFNSNILYSVTAQELKAEDMIKLPIDLKEHDTWQDAVNGAISRRAALAEAAQGEMEYIRPIVLFQAQSKDQEITVAVLKKHLMEVEQIPEDRVAIATGDQRQLDGIDLFDPKCRIEYVITIEALKEGWDCSFAYVFCSVSRIQSATDVEQLLGRVLRMPYAKRRKAEALNFAYADISETSFGAAAKALTDKLIAMGFDEQEAKNSIVPAQGSLDETGLFAPQRRPLPVFKHDISATPEVTAALTALAPDPAVSFLPGDDGTVRISVTGRIAPETEAIIAAAIPAAARPGFSEAVKQYRVEIKDQLSPAELGEKFVGPRLLAEIQGSFLFADPDIFMEYHDWSLSSHPAQLNEAAFSIRETARHFEIDVDGNRVSYQFAGEEAQAALDVDVDGWTPQNLVLWLDRQLHQPDIHPSDLLKWLTDSVGHLNGPRRIPIAALMRTKFILARKLRERLDAARLAEQEKAYQLYLFQPEARVDVSFENGFEFRDGMYRTVPKQPRGTWKPRKHFLGPDNLPAFDGARDGEEFQCAQAIDSVPEVKYWLRNVSQHPESFWLPRATGKHYPDFVAELTDGRFMVIEYKGKQFADIGVKRTDEARAVGRLFEQKSQGKGIYIMVERILKDRDMRGQIIDKIRTSSLK